MSDTLTLPRNQLTRGPGDWYWLRTPAGPLCFRREEISIVGMAPSGQAVHGLTVYALARAPESGAAPWGFYRTEFTETVR